MEKCDCCGNPFLETEGIVDAVTDDGTPYGAICNDCIDVNLEVADNYFFPADEWIKAEEVCPKMDGQNTFFPQVQHHWGEIPFVQSALKEGDENGI